jgi:hypothetical protein
MDRQLLARATEGTDAPTPGYLYVDLAKAATANPSAAQEMGRYLTRKLATKQNPHVKYKCLRVLTQLCVQVPRNAFARSVAQDPSGVAAVKEALQFRGPLDPVHGDTHNEKVRTAARECLDAVYTERPTSAVTEHPSQHHGGSSGHGHHHYQPNGSSSSSSRMQGIGNPRFADPRQDPRAASGTASGLQNAVKEAGEVVLGMIKDPLARNVGVNHAHAATVPRQGHSGNLPGYGGPQYGRPPPGAQELSRQTGGQWTMASNRGPGAITPHGAPSDEYYRAKNQSQQPPPSSTSANGIQNNYGWTQQHSSNQGNDSTNHHNSAAGGVGGSWAHASVTPSTGEPSYNHEGHSTPSVTVTAAPPRTGGSGGTAVTDGSYEKNLVLELCPPGGMKPVPPPDKLASFARAAPSLNADLICPVLLDCIEDGQPWIIHAKALCVMETCLQSDQPDRHPYRNFLFACHEEVAPLAAHARSAIKEPARRVLKLLGVTASTTASSAPATATANLLDFGEDNDNDHQQGSAPPPAVTTPASDDLFGGMQVKAQSSPPVPVATATATASVFDFVNDDGATAAPLATALAAAPPASVFDFVNDNGGATTVASAPANDLFGSDSHATTTTTDMFGGMSLKVSEGGGAEPATPHDPAEELAAVHTNGSAFGFINNSSSNSSKAGGESNLTTTQPSFDPLSQASPTLAQKKAMQMSPEQMQAVAYQQMMMQQQYQQMQMAMAMQHGGVGMPHKGGMPMQRMSSGGSMSHTGAGGLPMPVAGGGMRLSMGAPLRPQRVADNKFDFVKDAMNASKK